MLPIAAHRIGEPDPGEMEQFVDDDAAQFASIAPQRSVEHEFPPAQERGGMNLLPAVGELTAADSQAAPPLQLNGRSIEAWQVLERAGQRGTGSVKYFSSLNCIETDFRTESTH